MKDDLQNILQTSEFLKSVKTLKGKKGKSRLLGSKIRNLFKDEIKTLESQGNRASNWKTIYVNKEFFPEFIIGNFFIGQNVLGKFQGIEKKVENSVTIPSGIFYSTIINSEIGDDCLIYNTGTISNYLVKTNSIVYQTDSVIASENCTFGNGQKIAVGIETGGREVQSYAEITIPIAEKVAKNRGDKDLLKSYEKFIKTYTNSCIVHFGIIESDSIIRNSKKITNTYVGSGITVDNATLVENSTLLGSTDEPTNVSFGVFVRNSCIQWGCEVTSMAIIENSILTEHSHVERHGKVIHSIIGPNSSIAEGEVNSCLVGPFVGFHHQALLIAAVWPEGKGNVGYGANVGSNHTSKSPDQEIWCGEGVFFGLGTNIKFPSNFTEAPYSIFATAVNALPQKIEFPFSLINSPSKTIDNISPSFNEIFPGWVLSDNIYALKRNEGKYKKRNKARRTDFTFEVFRPDIIDKMIIARNKLRDIKQNKGIYTSRDFIGLGKNYMTETSRIAGMVAYNFYIEYYALSGLKQHLIELGNKNKKKINTIYEDVSSKPEWEYQRSILNSEQLSKRSIIENLRRLAEMQEKIANDVFTSKEKDDIRGRKIIDDYDSAHTLAAEDSFVGQVQDETQKIKKEIEDLTTKIQ